LGAARISRIIQFNVGRCPLLFAALAAVACAQDLEPRAYSASPVGTNFVVLAFGRSTGEVLFDPTIPITDVSATLNVPAAGYGRSFGIFGRQALATVALPYVLGSIEGNVGEQRREITRSGLADLRARISLNLYGSPAMSPHEFAKRARRSPIVGTSLSFTAPTGQYDHAKLINIGTNRWSFKPEIGFSYPVKGFYLDAYVGAWFFKENDAFFPGSVRRTQSSLTTTQAHVSYTIRRGLWLAADWTWYGGGEVSADGGPKGARRNNTRLGATFSVPLGKSQAVKFAYSHGVTARTGQDFKTVSAAWQFLWFDG
jgi:hypothetical protein